MARGASPETTAWSARRGRARARPGGRRGHTGPAAAAGAARLPGRSGRVAPPGRRRRRWHEADVEEEGRPGEDSRSSDSTSTPARAASRVTRLPDIRPSSTRWVRSGGDEAESGAGSARLAGRLLSGSVQVRPVIGDSLQQLGGRERARHLVDRWHGWQRGEPPRCPRTGGR